MGRDGFLLGGVIMLAAVWAVLVPVAAITGYRRRRTKEQSDEQG